MIFKQIFCVNCKKEILYTKDIPLPMHLRRKYCNDECNNEYQKKNLKRCNEIINFLDSNKLTLEYIKRIVKENINIDTRRLEKYG